MNYLQGASNFQFNQVPLLWMCIQNQQPSVQTDVFFNEDGKYEQLVRQNQELRQLVQKLQASIDRSSRKTSKKPQRKRRRHVEHLSKDYPCPYRQCRKEYASDLALNLHIRNKHNGGTKTQRESLAKRYILAQLRGLPKPQITLNFPPGYLQEFRNRFNKKTD